MELKKILENGQTIYFIGIKGTGMCAFAELMSAGGGKVLGSDRAEVFYTDRILDDLGIHYYQSFDADHIKDDFALVIHSAAYDAETNPEIAEALRRGLPVLKYTDALGLYSELFDSSGIAGVHGKTTTTAMAGALARGASLPAQVLAGSAVGSFGGRSTLSLGNTYFIAETCEYRRHFLSFRPRRIVLTSVESDHQDYYPGYESIRGAFLEYCRLLPSGGELIYCADDPGAAEIVSVLEKEWRPLTLTPYGFNAAGEFRITNYAVKNERAEMTIEGFPGTITLRIPGRHMAADAAGALALASSLVKAEYGGWSGPGREGARKALEEFRGSKRREEIIGEAGGILFMDDYGHHPTAIAATLEGLREFYPDRRIVVSFMSHTYSRTAALLDDFAASFKNADAVFLHKIYASAREQYSGGVDGRMLYEKTAALRDGVSYTEEPLDAASALKAMLKEGDLFITMGAGNNWVLAEELYGYFREKK
ncbi:MAG: UDP-N-acetylmuramate--L-alanine ligase [Treponema sp.]|jgi:UDP-N-acetylmuramate--alanine ligase|nr:UDP-N-acetylmuramate--L-alanine ligase [Treponema sp.]